jgi:hypothetical protein
MDKPAPTKPYLVEQLVLVALFVYYHHGIIQQQSAWHERISVLQDFRRVGLPQK